MRKKVSFLVLLLFFFAGSPIMAQTDTVIEDEVVVESVKGADTANYFNDLTEAEKSKVEVRQVRNTDVEKLRQDKAFWYTTKEKEKPKQRKADSSFFAKLFGSRLFGIILWTIIVGGFVGAIVWFLAASDVSFFRKRPKVLSTESEVAEKENIFEIDFEKELSKAIQSTDFRLAVRLMYLQTLKLLSEKDVIQYRQERTNGDYLMQLYGTSYYNDFFYLTRHFEYAWYGAFPVSSAAFEIVSQEYHNLKSRLPR